MSFQHKADEGEADTSARLADSAHRIAESRQLLRETARLVAKALPEPR